MAEALARYGNARRGAPISAAPHRERYKHLQPQSASVSPDAVTIEQLAPLDHFHARGFPATIELADALPIQASHHVVDIGCGIGGPAHYFTLRSVSGTALVGSISHPRSLLRPGQVEIVLGDGQHLPYHHAMFDGGYTQHVTMNIADRCRGFAG